MGDSAQHQLSLAAKVDERESWHELIFPSYVVRILVQERTLGEYQPVL